MAKDTPVTTADRVAVAGVSFIAALITVAVVVLIGFIGGGDFSIIVASAPWALAAAIVAALAGYAVGPDRATEWWGAIWGTEDAEKHRGFTAVVAIVIILVCLWSLLR